MGTMSFKALVEQNFTIAYLSTVVASFVAGATAWYWVEHNTGINPTSQSALVRCKEELSSQIDRNAVLASCGRESSSKSSSFDDPSRERVQGKSPASGDVLQSGDSSKETREARLAKSTSVPTASTVVSGPHAIWVDRVTTYLDGALNIIVDSARDKTACIRIAGAADCQSVKVGDMLPLKVGDQSYALRVDQVTYQNARLTLLKLQDSF